MSFPKWTSSAKLDLSFGYKDNLLLSHADPESSVFSRGEFETYLARLPEGRIDYFVALNGGATRYFSGQQVEHEAQAFLLGEWRYRIGEVFRFTVDTQSYYLDEVFDVSDTVLQRVVAPIKVTGFTIGPAIRWGFLPSTWIEARVIGQRERYRDGFEDSRVGEAIGRLGWHRGKRFEAAAKLAARHRDYDRREQLSVSGRSLAGTSLQMFEREAGVDIDATWDAAAQWRTTTSGAVQRLFDNGSGYFNYHQRKVSQDLEWTSENWLVRASGTAKRRVFDVQTAGFGIAPPARLKEIFSADMRVERKLTARWTIFAQYTWERSRSNDEIASYRVNEGLLGGRWSWDK